MRIHRFFLIPASTFAILLGSCSESIAPAGETLSVCHISGSTGALIDIKASELEVTALEKAYIANRQARDVLIERFRSTQGSLTDVLTSEDNYFQIAASYLQAVTRLDAERLVLLQRGGNLLPALGVNLTGSK